MEPLQRLFCSSCLRKTPWQGNFSRLNSAAQCNLAFRLLASNPWQVSAGNRGSEEGKEQILVGGGFFFIIIIIFLPRAAAEAKRREVKCQPLVSLLLYFKMYDLNL